MANTKQTSDYSKTPMTAYCIIHDRVKKEYKVEPKEAFLEGIMLELKSWGYLVRVDK